MSNRVSTELTPELASTLLASPHPKQRRVSKQVVESYARAIREGRWRLVDDALLVVGDIFAGEDDPKGSLFNGAHRCQAVVSTRRSIPVYIDWDADPSTFDLIDIGRKRNAFQFVSSTFATARAAAARLTLWYEHRFDRPPGGVNLVFDLHEVLKEAERRESNFEAMIPYASRTWEYTGLSTSVALAVYALANDFGYESEISDFVEGLMNPADREADDPARLLSDRFRHQAHRARRRRVQDDWTILVRALNLHLQGVRQSKLVMGEIWPRVAESETDYNRRKKAAFMARERGNDARQDHNNHKAGTREPAATAATGPDVSAAPPAASGRRRRRSAA